MPRYGAALAAGSAHHQSRNTVPVFGKELIANFSALLHDRPAQDRHPMAPTHKHPGGISHIKAIDHLIIFELPMKYKVGFLGVDCRKPLGEIRGINILKRKLIVAVSAPPMLYLEHTERAASIIKNSQLHHWLELRQHQ